MGGRLVFNMPKTPAQLSKGLADLIATAASEESSDFGMLKYTIQHGGHERTRSRLAKGGGWVALDLPRCDAQFPQFLNVTDPAGCVRVQPGQQVEGIRSTRETRF